MPLTVPPELKKITPFIRRAEELDKDRTRPESRLVAFYCRQYAVHIGIPFATSATGKGCLAELLGSLEQEKQVMDSFTRDEAKYVCRAFADQIFGKADQEDRVGAANKSTAKTFYAAASFLEILQQFYKDDDESEEREEEKKRIVYAKWKATEILKAIKEGRQPPAGGYGENVEECDTNEISEQSPNVDEKEPETVHVETVENDDDDKEEEKKDLEPSTSMSEGGRRRPPPPAIDNDDEEQVADQGTEVGLGPPPAYPVQNMETFLPPPAPSTSMANRPPVQFNPPPAIPPPMMPTVPTSKPQPPPQQTKKSVFFGLGGGSKKTPSKADMADAMELTKFALAALEDKNADLAAQRLKQALQSLGR